MQVVTASMRATRRARRRGERDLRGAPPRTRFGPHPSGLIASGWSPPRDAEPRLLGADAAAVVIADRACYPTVTRRVEVTVLPLPRVVTGPMPANPLSALTVAFAAQAADPEPSADAGEAGDARDDELPPGPWTMRSAPPVEPPAVAPGVPPVTVAPPVPTASAPVDPPLVPAPPSGHTSPSQPLPSDLFAHALGLSPANSPAPVMAPDTDTAPRREPRSLRRQRQLERARYERPRRRWWLAAAAVVVVLAGGGTAIGYAVKGGGRSATFPTSTASSSALAQSADVGAWLSANVPSDRRVVSTDSALATALNRAGVPVDPAPADVDQRVGVIVVRTDAGATPPAVLPVGTTRSLVDLAVFGSGSASVAIGQVVDGDEATVRGALETVAKSASTACRTVATDEDIVTAASVGPLLAAGGLDVRAATFLAGFADKQRVRIVAAPQDPAEKAAHRPVRTLVLEPDHLDALKQAAATADEPLAPEVDAPGSGVDAPAGSLVLSWPVDAAATLTVP